MSLVDLSPAEQRLAGRVDAGVTNALAVSDRAGGVQFSSAGEVMEFSKLMAIANSGVRKHLRGNPGACLAVCVQAVEWGLSPFAVANKSYFVNDQIAFESQLIQAVILKRAPIKGRLKFDFTGEGPSRVCRAWARLREDPEEVVEYVSPPFKDIQPKNSPLWKSDPDQQHCYMAGRALCRRHFPDVLLGVYADDELEPGVGPEKARDVTPPASLSEKFEQLAAAPRREKAAAVERQPVREAHDPETGEIHDHLDEGDQTDGGDVGQSDDTEAGTGHPAPASDVSEPGDAPRSALMHKLRGKADQGSKVLKRAFGGLVPAENEMLTTQDRRYLEGLAADADRERADA